MKKRITIKDIARELNIHHSTVSRALRNDPRVNVTTRDQVLSYAREHEYQTNMSALQLRGVSNNAIALIVPNINHSFFSDIVSKLTNLAYAKGYVISVFQTNEKCALEKEIINTIIQHNFAGVIVSIAKDTTNSEHFELLAKFGIPLVFFDRVCDDVVTPKVIVNNLEITREATSYLLGKGYRKIVHLTGTKAINVFRDRQCGYLEALEVAGISYRRPIEIEADFSIAVGQELFRTLWNSGERPDAVISSSVHLTAGIITEARKYGLRIPEEFGLITFGSNLTTQIIEPAVSYIAQPEAEIAEITFELLEKMINHETGLNENELRTAEATLVIQESC